MAHGHTATEFISPFGGMLGNSINRETEEVDPNPGDRSGREICSLDRGPGMDGVKDFGSRSHRPISRDSTAIEGREKPGTKPKKEKSAPGRRGRAARGERREPKPPSRLVRQVGQEAEEALREIRIGCDVGAKGLFTGIERRGLGISFMPMGMTAGCRSARF